MDISISFPTDGTVLLRSCYSDVPDATRELCDDSSYIDCKKCVGDNCNTATTRDGIKCHECSGVDCLIIETVSTVVDCRTSCYIGLNGKKSFEQFTNFLLKI